MKKLGCSKNYFPFDFKCFLSSKVRFLCKYIHFIIFTYSLFIVGVADIFASFERVCELLPTHRFFASSDRGKRSCLGQNVVDVLLIVGVCGSELDWVRRWIVILQNHCRPGCLMLIALTDLFLILLVDYRRRAVQTARHFLFIVSSAIIEILLQVTI